MGLSVVRSVATEYGGEVVMESAEGFGSCFRVRLPVAPAEVKAAVLDCQSLGGENYFSAAGCEIPDQTPPENLFFQAEALRKSGSD